MEPLKDQDWSNMTNRDIAEVISRLKPKLRYRLWHHAARVLWRVSKRYRRHCILYHCTNAREPKPSEPLTLEDIRKHLENMSR